MDAVVAFILLDVPTAYVVAQIRSLRRWRGWRRVAAALPLAAWLAWGALFGVEVSLDPTSHNLFPFEVLFLALGSLTWFGLLVVAGRASAGGRSR